jgi:hypothetical protein
VIALRVRGLRAFALAVLLQMAMTLRPGYLPQGHIVAVLPFAALLLAGVADRAVRTAAGRRRLWGLLAAVPALGAVAALASAWSPADALQVRARDQVGVPAALSWMKTHIPPERHIVVDDNVWLDLARAGYPIDPPRPSVVWVYKIGTDPAIRLTSVDYIVYAMNPIYAAQDIPQVVSLFRDSYVIATFGSGDNKVVVRKVVHTRL